MTTSATGAGIAALTVSGNGFIAEIAYEGATLLSWRPRLADGTEGENLIDGYSALEELQSQNGVRNGILAPFTNRIPQGQFNFGGEMHRIEPVLANENLVFHGFARALPFAVDRSFEDNGAHVLVFRAEILPTDFKGYPYHLAIEVEYRFAGNAVTIDIRGIMAMTGHCPLRLAGTPISVCPAYPPSTTSFSPYRREQRSKRMGI